jgi:circadian clock protein KaiC
MAIVTKPFTKQEAAPQLAALPKSPTGIMGLDEVTQGGLPRGRPSLVCGPAGCGKTLLAVEFLVRGIGQFGEPGVFVAFEETRDDLVANVASMGFDLARFESEGMLVVDHVSVVPNQMTETGDRDLEAL